MSVACLPEVVTLGCRLNIAEGQVIRDLLGTRDVVAVNSCAVTEAAVKRTRAEIRRLRARRPTAELVVTGCAAQIDPDGFAAMAEVDRVVGNPDKLSAAAWAPGAAPTLSFRPEWQAPPESFAGDTSRGFLEVQNGCDHACTFCVIPAGRGPARSAPVGAVGARAEAMVAAGRRELVLTGVDLTSWRDETGAGLGALVERLLDVRELERLRLSSLDPAEMDDRLLALVTGERRVQPHLHFSFQAGDDLVLKRMKRRHLRGDAVRLVERIRAARSDVAIGADLIAGFPTEDEAMFARTLALLDDCDIVQAHVFPYSAKSGTPAARMPQVPMPVRRERAARLRMAAGERRARWLRSLIGSVQQVLVERPGTKGHAGNFAEVRVPPSHIGAVIPVRIVAATDIDLEGILL